MIATRYRRVTAGSARSPDVGDEQVGALHRSEVAALVEVAPVPVPPDHVGPTVTAAALSTFTAACRDRERLRFDYRSHAGETSRREVEPYRLVNWGPALVSRRLGRRA